VKAVSWLCLTFRLRELLRKENELHRIECENTRSTALDQQNQLRERARNLRERRNAERLVIVEQKLEQQFR